MENLKNLLSFGNTKLPKSTAIFNMGPAHECPSEKLGLCEVADICYAKKAERLYKGCRPYRTRQKDYWLESNPTQFVNEFMDAIRRKRANPVKEFRFNESGDFWSQDCVTNLEIISGELEDNDIVTYGYTARKDLDFQNVKCAYVNGSGFLAKGINNIFTPVDEFTGNNPKCKGDCVKCNLCYQKLNNCIIEVKKH